MGIARLLSGRRWVTLTCIAVVLVIACALLGRWQYGRSYRPVDGYSQEPAAVSLDSVDSPAHPLAAAVTDRQVLLSGRYDAGQQRLIAGHILDGTPVLWVVTPLSLSDGSEIEVVRGWMSSADPELEAPPESRVDVTGRILPLQPSPPGAATAAPGYAIAIDASLLHQLPNATRDGYVVRTAQTPPDPLSLQPVPSQAPRAPQGAKQFHLLSAFYTVQWWLFAVLILVAWQRLFTAELAEKRLVRAAG
jgi:cytochrome oxidase assembly protein ShyY1